MAELGNKNNQGDTKDLNETVTGFVERLGDEHRMLIILKKQLYAGSWDPMINDLKNRLIGKPYIFKLVNRINDDIERIEYMRCFEEKHNIDLSNFIDLDNL